MKNLLKISLMFVALLLVVTTVNAVTTTEFIEYVNSSKYVTASQKAEVERYLKVNNVSEDDLTYIQEKCEEVVAIMDAAGVTDVTKLNDVDRAKVIQIANDVSAKTGIKYTVNANGTLTLYNLDGTVFSTFSKTVKQTGSNNYAYIPVIAIVAVAIVFISKRGLANAR